MNMLSTGWFYEQEIEENSFININPTVGEIHETQFNFPNSFSSLDTTHNDHSYDDMIEVRPSKILKTTYILPVVPPPPSPIPPNSKPHFHHHPSSRILSFGNAGPQVMDQEYSPTYLDSIFSTKVEAEGPSPWMNELITNRKGIKRSPHMAKCQSNAQEHVIAERKRREKLTERFVALSALVPDLKKMDKASVLRDAVKHIKNLQERVKEFEKEKKEKSMESMVLVKKSKLILDDNNQSSSSSSSCCKDDSSGLDLPEIEVRFSDEDVLIKILCEKQKGNIAKIMAEVENFPFTIINSSVLPFGPTLDITIIAKKEIDFNMTIMDVVKSLRSNLSKFM